MDTATFVKESRKLLGLTQMELACLIDKERTNISLYESGKTIPPGNVVLKLIELRFPALCLAHSHTCNLRPIKKQEQTDQEINLEASMRSDCPECQLS